MWLQNRSIIVRRSADSTCFFRMQIRRVEHCILATMIRDENSLPHHNKTLYLVAGCVWLLWLRSCHDLLGSLILAIETILLSDHHKNEAYGTECSWWACDQNFVITSSCQDVNTEWLWFQNELISSSVTRGDGKFCLELYYHLNGTAELRHIWGDECQRCE